MTLKCHAAYHLNYWVKVNTLMSLIGLMVPEVFSKWVQNLTYHILAPVLVVLYVGDNCISRKTPKDSFSSGGLPNPEVKFGRPWGKCSFPELCSQRKFESSHWQRVCGALTDPNSPIKDTEKSNSATHFVISHLRSLHA